MATNNTSSPYKRDKFPYREYRHTYQIMGGITFIIVGMWVGFLLVGQERSIVEGNALSYWTNVITEILGVVVTIAVINQFTLAREKEKLRKRLIRQAGSPSQAIATEAIAQLREEGWLTGDDGVLKEVDLRGANLSGANLSYANLRGTKLYQANLSHAILEHADLQKADLRETDMTNVRMSYASCVEVDLSWANMEKSAVWYVDFTRANLTDVNLSQSSCPHANFTETLLEKTDFSGSNLKWAHFVHSSFSGTNFEGAEMINAMIEYPGYGIIFQGLPEKRVYLTKLPNGVAVGVWDDIEEFLENVALYDADLPSTSFVHGDVMDWSKFTDHKHPEYQDYRTRWYNHLKSNNNRT